MKLSTIFAPLALLPVIYAVNVSYDTVYDNAGQSLATVACSDGTNGLLTKGFTTFGSLPSFPRIGGAPAVTGWNSPACGTCWRLTYNGRSINVLAIDVARGDFNIGLNAMNQLTNGQAVALGRVPVDVAQIANSGCGLR
ncbi:unnamed protein product [Cyclocybe aegerita]|uniref:Cerato-platanin n=1 Tax=Cyclocybe aegerita TaxID=1973307 RepID=A0A8S0W6Y2_CYCAE|nr:unnamed protein product [Cyclocybe aegerita]